MKKILLCVIPSGSAELISLADSISNLQSVNYTIDVKFVVNFDADAIAKDFAEKHTQNVLKVERDFGLGKIHKIVFEYSMRKGYDFVIVANSLQYRHLLEHRDELLNALQDNTAYLTSGDTVKTQIGLVDFIQRKVFKKQINLFPKICIYNTAYLQKIPYLYNSDDDSFVNEIAIQIVLSDFHFVEIIGDIKVKIPYRIKIKTLKVFLKAYVHTLGIFYQNMFDIIQDNFQYSLKLGYASSHTYAIDAVEPNSKVIDIGAGPYGVGHELIKKNCTIVTVDQFDIPEQYKLSQHYVTKINADFAISIKEYDYILLLDIIEHLESPEDFIFNLSRQFSYKKQRLVLTTANISFFPVRMMLLLGYFNYGKSGILDKTHTRLFTFDSFKKLVTDARLNVLSVKGIPAPYPKAIGDNFISRALIAINLFFIKISKGFFSYQIYIEAETAPSVYYIVDENLKHEGVVQ